MIEAKYVYFFGASKSDGNADMKDLLGGKGANLAEMVNLNLPVPSGFTITTDVCTYYYGTKKKVPFGLGTQVVKAINEIEKDMGGKFGSEDDPLLLSVRSGARTSMPGMMDTILNIGLNDRTVQGLIAKTSDARFSYDCYRRFVQMFGDVVYDMKPESKDDMDPFESIISNLKKKRGIKNDLEFTVDDLKKLVSEFKHEIQHKTKKKFPDKPYDQLWESIYAVFNSWMNPRAIAYRRINDITESFGTAVNVQAMVFGNLGNNSATGVAFTRNPSTGERKTYGEFLVNAQGEDIVAGTRTPTPISELEKKDKRSNELLLKISEKLENHYKDMMDIEFTIENGKLYILQCRVGKRTAFSSIKIAVDMVKEKLITEEEALMRIEPNQLNQLLRPVFNEKEKNEAIKNGKLIAVGLNAGPGAACGKVYFNAEDIVEKSKHGQKTILVRIETSPDDIRGMHHADGILTARGGMTSHAALVGRQMGKVCVVGCETLHIDYKKRIMTILEKNVTVHEGEEISIDGTTGEVFIGKIHTKSSEVISVLVNKTLKPNDAPTYQLYSQIMEWADRYRMLRIRTNADQPDQCKNAVALGAEGIGLCRTEHMFFGENRIDIVREMILAETSEERKKAIDKLLPLQRKDFYEIFLEMKQRPVTIRTLDPPLHEFLPRTENEILDLSKKTKVPKEKIHSRIEQLHEMNPMLGFRGCRLGIVYPEITSMQAKAIFEAIILARKDGIKVNVEIMIPLISNVQELKLQKKIVDNVAEEIMKAKKTKLTYSVGTMIEVPRAALTSDEIANVAEFFSFGTNDLTQMTNGLSRDDSGKFLQYYLEEGVYERDPFQSIDRIGVGKLMSISVKEARNVNQSLKIGICGEHGGDPSSIEFCHKIGLNYVSCSPFRIPIAKLAAARASISEKRNVAPQVDTSTRISNSHIANKLQKFSNAKRAILLKNSSLRKNKNLI